MKCATLGVSTIATAPSATATVVMPIPQRPSSQFNRGRRTAGALKVGAPIAYPG